MERDPACFQAVFLQTFWWRLKLVDTVSAGDSFFLLCSRDDNVIYCSFFTSFSFVQLALVDQVRECSVEECWVSDGSIRGVFPGAVYR